MFETYFISLRKRNFRTATIYLGKNIIHIAQKSSFDLGVASYGLHVADQLILKQLKLGLLASSFSAGRSIFF